jgi:hypothetical protein
LIVPALAALFEPGLAGLVDVLSSPADVLARSTMCTLTTAMILEPGPDVDNKINIMRAGPTTVGPVPLVVRNRYDDSVPMTDLQRFPDAVPRCGAHSGRGTEAICGAAFITGEQWSGMPSLLAVAALKGAELAMARAARSSVLSGAHAGNWHSESGGGRP